MNVTGAIVVGAIAGGGVGVAVSAVALRLGLEPVRRELAHIADALGWQPDDLDGDDP